MTKSKISNSLLLDKFLNYIDVTNEWLDKAKPNSHKVLDKHYFLDEEGKRYDVDG